MPDHTTAPPTDVLPTDLAEQLFLAGREDERFAAILPELADEFRGHRKRAAADESVPGDLADEIALLDTYVAYRRRQIDHLLETQVEELANDETERGLLTDYIAGGERFAGVLACIASEVFATSTATLQRHATIAELVMNSFLVIDDLLDGHTERRGSRSIWHEMKQRHDVPTPEAAGIASLYQNMLLQRAFALAEAPETQHVCTTVDTAVTGALTEAEYRRDEVDGSGPERWRTFCRKVSSGLQLPFALAAEQSPLAVTPDQVREVSRAFGLFEQTIDNSVDDQLPESLSPEEELRRNARRTTEAAGALPTESRLFEMFVPWFFYAYFRTHPTGEIDPGLLYRSSERRGV